MHFLILGLYMGIKRNNKHAVQFNKTQCNTKREENDSLLLCGSDSFIYFTLCDKLCHIRGKQVNMITSNDICLCQVVFEFLALNLQYFASIRI
jgi:hypothetical protein